MAETDTASRPTPARQVSYIIDNATILDVATKSHIYRLVALSETQISEGDSLQPPDAREKTSSVILTDEETREPSINLDEIKDKDLIYKIYTIVAKRRADLDRPACDDFR